MMDDYVLVAGTLKLAYALLAVFGLVTFTRWLDRRSGVTFSEVAARFRDNPLASATYYGLRILALALLVGAVIGCTPADARTFTSRYDAQIHASVDRWWPDYPHWLAWKGQLYQESRLDPNAVSPVGAKGLAQFMPGTWRGVARELRLPAGASPTQDIAIDAGAYYMAQLRRAWRSPRPGEDRHQLAQASYNAGLGNLLKAQTRCGGKARYAEIAACLPQVTGAASRETLGYVTAIARWRAAMEAGL
jgi:hypothetical protein